MHVEKGDERRVQQISVLLPLVFTARYLQQPFGKIVCFVSESDFFDFTAGIEARYCMFLTLDAGNTYQLFSSFRTTEFLLCTRKFNRLRQVVFKKIVLL